MKKVSIAELKRLINGTRVKFIANFIGSEVPFDKISKVIETLQDQPYSIVKFNTVDMMRTMEDGEVSYCQLKGLKAFMSDKGFIMVAPWGTQVNVMVYQF